MAQRFDADVLKKMDQSFNKQWKKFKKCLKQEGDWAPLLNEHVVLVHRRQGKAYRMAIGRDKVKKHMNETMPHITVKEHEIFIDEYPAEILTGATVKNGDDKADIFIKHDAIRVELGTYHYNSDGEYTAVWIHQDECFWEIIFMDFRE